MCKTKTEQWHTNGLCKQCSKGSKCKKTCDSANRRINTLLEYGMKDALKKYCLTERKM